MKLVLQIQSEVSCHLDLIAGAQEKINRQTAPLKIIFDIVLCTRFFIQILDGFIQYVYILS